MFLVRVLTFLSMILTIALPNQSQATVSCSSLFSNFHEATSDRLVHLKVTDTEEIPLNELVLAAIHLQSGSNPKYLSQEIRDQLRSLVKVITDTELARPENIEYLFFRLREKMGDEEFETVVGSKAQAVKMALMSPFSFRDKKMRQKRDLLDMQRNWGWKLLPDNDKAFNDPGYLALLLKESNASGWMIHDKAKVAVDRFKNAWKKIAPSNVPPPSVFTLTGTDANNLLYEIAESVVEDKRPWFRPSPGSVEILSFKGNFAGLNGRMNHLHSAWTDSNSKFLLSNPITTQWNPTDHREVSRLEAMERKALHEIWWSVKFGKTPIGGILLEPIVGAHGVFFYRKEFLLELRRLCDKLKIPIFADEILTGGGRTGKFFAYQHYEGFEPDFITFGKGLQVAGIVQVERPAPFIYRDIVRRTTLNQYSEQLLKSAQILHRIESDHLMENAEKSGNYLLRRLGTQLPPQLSPLEKSAALRGKGLLIWGHVWYAKTEWFRDTSVAVRHLLEFGDVTSAYGRLMPYLTLSPDEIDMIWKPVE